MRTNPVSVVLAAGLALALTAPGALAAWQPDGNLVNAPGLLNPWAPVMVPMPDGGCIVLYVAHATGYHDIYAQRYDAWGGALWDEGRPVVIAANEQYAPVAVNDGADGAIVAWTDFRSGVSEGVYAQHLDGEGSRLWATDGVALAASAATQPRICTDHAGGAVVAWRDRRVGNNDIYAQRLDPSGTGLWTAGGFGVCTSTADQADFVMTDNGRGGAYFVWTAAGATTDDVFAQHVNAGGWLEWYSFPAGLLVCNAAGDQWSPQAAADGHGRLFAAWIDGRAGYYDIYAQLVSPGGSGQWSVNGIAAATGPGGRYDEALAADDAGGLYIAWDQGDVFAQHIAADGSLPWGTAGVPVCEALGSQNVPTAVPDGEGGVVVAWEDNRFTDYDIRTQRLNPEGARLWPADGVVLCGAVGDQRGPRLVVDGAGGGYVAWEDDREDDFVGDIYVQRVDRWGDWGYPSPDLTAVDDVPGDEGWQVEVSWDASRLDLWPSETIATYSVWRALAGSAPAALPADAVVVDLADFKPGAEGPVVRRDLTADGTFYWEYLGDVAARHLPRYATTAPTLFNLTPVCQDYHAFQVVAHGETPLGAAYWVSEPDTGRSVDNLAPATPAALVGKQVYDPVRLELSWEPNTERDLSHYVVHRGTAPDFVPSAGSLVATVTEPTASDPAWQMGSAWYYKVAAVDVNGNTGSYAVLAPASVSGTGTEELPTVTTLAGLRPNPFNPRGEVVFTVGSAQRITITVRDVAGRRVAILTDGIRARGVHRVVWDGRDAAGRDCASGAYLLELRSRDGVATGKIMLLR